MNRIAKIIRRFQCRIGWHKTHKVAKRKNMTVKMCECIREKMDAEQETVTKCNKEKCKCTFVFLLLGKPTDRCKMCDCLISKHPKIYGEIGNL